MILGNPVFAAGPVAQVSGIGTSAHLVTPDQPKESETALRTLISPAH